MSSSGKNAIDVSNASGDVGGYEASFDLARRSITTWH